MHGKFLAHRLIASLILILGAVVPLTVLAENTDGMMRAAIAHHDRQEFDEAIRLFQRVLDLEPDNLAAAYELAFTHQTRGDFQSCTAVAGGALGRLRDKVTQPYVVPSLYMSLASCHSAAGDNELALDVFQTGLDQYPDNYGLNFNIAITLANTGQYNKAIGRLEQAINADPSHPSPYYVLGTIYQQREQRVSAVLAMLIFLQREFDTPRCAEAARSIFEIAFSGVTTDESGGSTIYFDPDTTPDSPDVAALSLILSMAAAVAAPDGEVQEPVAESLADLLQAFIGVTAELEPEPKTDSLFSVRLFPDVRRIPEAGVTTAFAYYVVHVAGIADADEWTDTHREDADALADYFEQLAAEQ